MSGGNTENKELNGGGWLLLLMVLGGLVAFLTGLGMLFFGDSASTALIVAGAGLFSLIAAFTLIRLFGPDRWQKKRIPEEQKPLASSARVARLAAQHGLGDHIFSRKGTNPLAMFGLIPLGIAVVVGLLWILEQIAGASGIIGKLAELAGSAALYLIAIACALAIAAVIVFPKGFVRTHLYTYGLIYSFNGRLHAVTWPEIERLVLSRAAPGKMFAGKVLAYHLVTRPSASRGAKRLKIEAQPHLERDPFGDHLIEFVRRQGRPIMNGGPAIGDWRHRRV
jgi:hypothetical protein